MEEKANLKTLNTINQKQEKINQSFAVMPACL